MQIIKIFLGILALFLAWAFIFKKPLVFQINAWMHEHIFNDQLALFSGPRLALLLFILGGVSLFSGIENVGVARRSDPELALPMFEYAQQEFRQRHYAHVIAICKGVLKIDPYNADAWEILANAQWAVGEKEKAHLALQTALSIDPNHLLAKETVRRFGIKVRGTNEPDSD